MTDSGPGRVGIRRPIWLLLALALVGVPICLWTLFANVTLGEAESFIKAPLHSAAVANYAQDPLGGRLQSLSIRVIEFAIQDREPDSNDAGARATEVVEGMQTSVPTVTPKPSDTTATPTRTPSPLPTLTPTHTPTSPSPGTATLTPSASPTRTPTATPTNSPTSGPSSTPSKTPTPGPSSTASKTPTPSMTPTVCKVTPRVELDLPADGTVYGPGAQIQGQARAWDPDNVNPSNCAPTPETNGSGIVSVEFVVKKSGTPVFSNTETLVAYCAFDGSGPCNTVSVNGGQWPNSAPITSGVHELWARALDDDGQHSEWDVVSFSIVLSSTGTPSPTFTPSPTASPTATQTPTIPPTPSCFLSGFSGASNDVRWTLTNGGTSGTIDQIDLVWTLSGGLDKIKLEGADIWDGYINPSPANISSGWTAASRFFNPSEAKELRFRFDNSVGGHTFTVSVHFDNGCTVGASEGA